MNIITENQIEQIALQYFENLGYKIVHGPDISPDGEHPERQYNEVILITRLRDAIDKLNSDISFDAREDALKKVLRSDSHDLMQNNILFHQYLTDGYSGEA